MKIKFYPERKKSKSGENAIWCYVREYKETIYLNTGQKINTDFWDPNLQCADPRKTRNNIIKGSLKSLNQFLDAYKDRIWEIERSIRKKNPGAGFGVVADAIKSQFERRKAGFYDIYDEFIEYKSMHVTPRFLSRHKRNKELLLQFQKLNNERLNFEKMTPLFFDKYRSFLVNKIGMINNTSFKHITLLKTFLIWANVNNYTSNNSYRAYKIKNDANEVIFLSETELMKLYDLELEEPRLSRVRDIFVFQCFTGVRYSDIQNISREDIINGVWKVRTQKTRQIIDIPLNSYAISILAKYSEFPQPLPVISNQKMNSYLKELCEKAEIEDPVKIVKYKGNERIENTYKKYEVIGTHTARRTFISLSLQKGMKPDVIMAITGHTTYKMMQRYLKIADEHKREEMDKVWGPSVRLMKG